MSPEPSPLVRNPPDLVEEAFRSERNATAFPIPDISGSTISALFTNAAEDALSDTEIAGLRRFMNTWTTPQNAEYLHEQLSERLRTFYGAEILASSGLQDRLARPSGPENAIIGLIMHCQSKEGEIDFC